MNERIKLLAEQAGMKHPVMGEISYANFSYEEFAELIVRECCKEIKEAPFNAGAASDWLKQHFGVER